MHRPPIIRLVLAIGGLLAALLAVGATTPVVAAPTYADVKSITFSPPETVFSSSSETLTATVKVDRPGTWDFTSAVVRVRDARGYVHDDWLIFTGEDDPPGQIHTLTFSGQIPNTYGGLNRGYVQVIPEIWYEDSNNNPRTASVPSPGFWSHNLVGDTIATLSLSGSNPIPAGSGVALSGTVTCYGDGVYLPPPYDGSSWYGWVTIEYRVLGSSTWNYAGGGPLNAAGTWAETFAPRGVTSDWRVTASSLSGHCEVEQTVLRVEEGAGAPPPPPPTLPGAPGLTLGQVTQTTAALDWSPASGTGIIGYRFGWESSNGLPQPAWSRAYTLGELAGNDPFVMTNLHPGTTYSMWVEAINGAGAGSRSTIAVTTVAAPTPPPTAPPTTPPPPLPPTIHEPGKVTGLVGRAGNHKATLRWDKPASDAVIQYYQVQRFHKTYVVTARRLTARNLLNGKVYWFKVRAYSAAGWGDWSQKVGVRPHR